MKAPPRPLVFAIVFAALVAVAAFAYAPGLGGVFVFDSVARVVNNEALEIDALEPDALVAAAYAGQSDYPRRGLSFVSFALDYYFAGGLFDPFAFKLTNLVIHCFNALLVMTLAGLILMRWNVLQNGGNDNVAQRRAVVLACFAAGMWMLHPILLTSVLYVVQRMTSLAATCVLMGSIGYLLARARFDRGASYSLVLMYANVAVFTGVGFLFKQNALLLPAFIGVMEIFLFDRRLAVARRRKLIGYFAVTLMIPILAAITLLVFLGDSIGSGYATRDFDMLERMMTQSRVLFLYLGLLLIPDIRRFGLYHDDVAASSGLLDPSTTLLAVLAWTIIAVLVLVTARRRAPWAFAIAWFLAGHAMESSVLPLELVHEHRNYVPSVGIWIGVAFYAGVVWERAGRLRRWVPYALAAWIIAMALTTHVRARAWRDPAVLMETLARHHPQSYRAASGYAFNTVPRNADLGIRFDAFKRAAILNDRAVSPLIQMSKIAMQLRMHLAGNDTTSLGTLDGSGGIRVAKTVLRADAEHTERVLSSLDEAINRRLEHALPRTESVVALFDIVDCSVEGEPACVALRPAVVRWHASALRNPRLQDHLRAGLELSSAKLHALAGRRDQAVEHARRAGRVAGANLSYRLQEATLYALLERWPLLGETLDEIAVRFPARADTDPSYRDLRIRYQQHTNE